MNAVPFFIEIASTGQISIQASQPVHLSLSTTAAMIYLRNKKWYGIDDQGLIVIKIAQFPYFVNKYAKIFSYLLLR